MAIFRKLRGSSERRLASDPALGLSVPLSHLEAFPIPDQNRQVWAAYPLRLGAICAELALKAYTKQRAYPLQHAWFNLKFVRGVADSLIAYDDDTIVIAISGVNALDDWLLGLNFQGFSQGSITASQGPWLYALHAFRDICDTLALLRENPLRDRKLVLCGHSLGGCAAALLPLAAEVVLADSQQAKLWGSLFSTADFQPTQVFTYGSPKCIHMSNTAVYPWPMWNFMHVNDLVPIWPISVRNKRNRIGSNIWLTSDSRIRSRGRLTSIGWSLASIPLTGFRLKSVAKYHSQTNYVQLLNRFYSLHDWRQAVLGIP